MLVNIFQVFVFSALTVAFQNEFGRCLRQFPARWHSGMFFLVWRAGSAGYFFEVRFPVFPNFLGLVLGCIEAKFYK